MQLQRQASMLKCGYVLSRTLWSLTLVRLVQELVSSWALGSQQLRFVTKAIFEPSTHSYYVVVQQSNASTSSSHSLLSWPATAASGSLEQLAHRHTLTGTVHSIHPISAHSKHTPHEADAGAGNSPVAIVYTDGRAALGTNASVQAAERPAGVRLLSSHADADTLAVICKFKGVLKYQLDLYGLQVSREELPAQHAFRQIIPSPFIPADWIDAPTYGRKHCMP